MGDHTKSFRSKELILGENCLEQKSGLKIFISYSHHNNTAEEQYIEDFIKHIAPLKESGLVDVWYDRLILPGEDLHEMIEYHLEDADIVCLFVSSDFLNSGECRGEKKKALELRKMEGVQVISVILSPCGWEDDPDISPLLVLPTDGKPVSEFKDKRTAWQDVYGGLKRVIEKELKIRRLVISDDFQSFLHDAEMLTKAHPKKESVSLDDVYIDVKLDKFNSLKEGKETINSNELLNILFTDGRIIVAGEDQSGKTTLCKKIFCELRSLNFIPVYLSNEKYVFPGKIDNIISKSLHEQYIDIDEREIGVDRIVPILDDFHRVKGKEKHIADLLKYRYCIVVGDDIFSLNIKDKTLISSFTTFKIKELKPSLIYELVKKWVSLSDKDAVIDYKSIDKNIDLLNTTLGRNIGKGVLPAYPFFVLSTIVTYETLTLPLDRDITSQGYCYQAFIYYYLRKRGVREDEIDIYVNFLTRFASHMHKGKLEEFDPDGFLSFMKLYSDIYNLPVEQEILITNLSEIVSQDSFGNYSFKYPCFYYFFAAKALSEHIEEPTGMEEICAVLNNLHVDENAYIAVFLTHHSKTLRILDEIGKVALSLFNGFEPATLMKDEVRFFDEQAHNIVKAVLPPANVTPEMERTERLKIQDELEQSHEEVSQEEHSEENDIFTKDFRKAIKTVEVMGCIIRNRAGSLEKVKLQKIFRDGMDVHLRMLSSFFELMKSGDKQEEMVDYISKRLSHLEGSGDSNKFLDEELRRKTARKIFWNFNFLIMYGIIHKIVHSLGSDKLTGITTNVCDEVNTPASFLIKHGIYMEYNKNLQIKELEKRHHASDFPKIAKRAIEFMVVDYCSLHPINYRDLKRVEDCLEIHPKKLLSGNH